MPTGRLTTACSQPCRHAFLATKLQLVCTTQDPRRCRPRRPQPAASVAATALPSAPPYTTCGSLEYQTHGYVTRSALHGSSSRIPTLSTWWRRALRPVCVPTTPWLALDPGSRTCTVCWPTRATRRATSATVCTPRRRRCRPRRPPRTTTGRCVARSTTTTRSACSSRSRRGRAATRACAAATSTTRATARSARSTCRARPRSSATRRSPASTSSVQRGRRHLPNARLTDASCARGRRSRAPTTRAPSRAVRTTRA